MSVMISSLSHELVCFLISKHKDSWFSFCYQFLTNCTVVRKGSVWLAFIFLWRLALRASAWSACRDIPHVFGIMCLLRLFPRVLFVFIKQNLLIVLFAFWFSWPTIVCWIWERHGKVSHDGGTHILVFFPLHSFLLRHFKAALLNIDIWHIMPFRDELKSYHNNLYI